MLSIGENFSTHFQCVTNFSLPTFDRILLRAVPLLSRESRCVKHDAGRSPDFRSFGALALNPCKAGADTSCKPKFALQNLPIDLCVRHAERAYYFSLEQKIVHSGGAVADSHRASLFSVMGIYPCLQGCMLSSAPEPLVYSIVMAI